MTVFRLHDHPDLQRLVNGPRRPQGLLWRPAPAGPLRQASLPAAARRRLLAAVAAGTPQRLLAQRFGVSRRTVGRLVQAARA